MGVKGTVTEAESGKGIPNALIQVQNVTRVGKGQRRSDLINHDVTTGIILIQNFTFYYF